MAPDMQGHEIWIFALRYLPFSPSGGALLFHLLSKLYERTSHHHHKISASANGPGFSATPR
jgi:hypothetical protein